MHGHSQAFEFPIFFEDSLGNRDNIILGLDPEGSLGIEEQFGEVNIVDQPYKAGLDVRMSDGFEKAPHGIPTSYHLKKQILGTAWSGFGKPFDIEYIDVLTEHFPVKAWWDSTHFKEDIALEGSLITSVPPGGWWDVSGYSSMGRVILSEQDSVVFTSNVFNDQYYVGYKLSDTLAVPVYFFTFGPQGIEVGVDEVWKEMDMNVFPNPVREELNADGEGVHQIELLQLFDLSGREVFSFSNVQFPLNLAGLNSGVYVLRVFFKDHIQASRLLVKE